MPRRNSHCSAVSWIHLPLRASTAFLGTETSTQWVVSAANANWGRVAKAAARAREYRFNMRASFKVGRPRWMLPRLTNLLIVLSPTDAPQKPQTVTQQI